MLPLRPLTAVHAATFGSIAERHLRSTSWPGCYRIFSLNIRTSRSTCRSATSASIQFSERVDVTIRVGPLHDSELIAVRLGEVRRVIAASPHYLATHGTP